MNEASDNVSRQIFFVLWYPKNDIPSADIAKFVKTNQELLTNIGTQIKVGPAQSIMDSIWFDIIKRENLDSADSFYRFRYVYKKSDEGVIKGLENFEKVLKFTMSSKRKKRSSGINVKYESTRRNKGSK